MMVNQSIPDNDTLRLTNNLQYHVITDFVQTFENDTGLPITSLCQIVQDSNSIFNGFSYFIQHLLTLIDSITHCQLLIIKGLTVDQRRDFYVELSKIRILFYKHRYLDNNSYCCTDITISIVDIWSFHDYRTTPDNPIYRYSINIFNEFYSDVDNSLNVITHPNSNISIALQNFIKFKRIYDDALAVYNNRRYYYYTNTNTNSNYLLNAKIKHQLADLIFDIKDDLTDAMYKDILEKIALISP